MMRVDDQVLEFLGERYEWDGLDPYIKQSKSFAWYIDFLFAPGKFGSPAVYNEFGYSNYGRPSIWELFKYEDD